MIFKRFIDFSETFVSQPAFEPVSVPGLLFGLHWCIQDRVLSRLEDIVKGQDEIRDELKNLRELTQREFTNSFRREQAKIDLRCPNVFVLRPHKTRSWQRAFVSQKIDLKLYCQEPGCWHPTEKGGLYTIDEPAKWLQTMAPYIHKLLSVLKYAAPLVGPWVGTWNKDDYENLFQHNIELMKELVLKLPDLQDSPKLKLSSAIGERINLERSEGSALRALRLLLNEKDPQQYWGGLKPVLTPEGHYLWLCEYHAALYCSGSQTDKAH